MKKSSVYIIGLMFLIMLVTAFVQDEESGGGTSINLTFSGNDTQQMNIEIPKYSSILDAKLSIDNLVNNSADFYDRFNRPNNPIIGNNWSKHNTSTNCNVLLENNTVFNQRAAVGTCRTAIYRDLSNVNSKYTNWSISYDFTNTGGGLSSIMHMFHNGTNNLQSDAKKGASAPGLAIFFIATSPMTIQIYFNGTQLASAQPGFSSQLQNITAEISYNGNTINITYYRRMDINDRNVLMYNVTLNATNFTGDKLAMIFSGNSGSSERTIIDNLIIGDDDNSIINPQLDIGSIDHIYEFSTIGRLMDNRTINLTSKLAAQVTGNCTGVNMTLLSNDGCSVPFYFSSDRSGIMKVYNISINYSLHNSTLNITFLDSTSLNRLDNIINISASITHPELSRTTTTNTPEIIFQNINFSSSGKQNFTGLFKQEDGTDYSTVTRSFSMDQGLNTTLIVYLTNTSDLTSTLTVTFLVQDVITGNRLGGAILRVLKYIPSTNSYVTIADLVTNSNGQATTILQIDSVYYRFLVDYEGDRVFTSNPQILSSSDSTITLSVNLEETFTDRYLDYFDINVGLRYVETTNFSGRFQATYSSPSVFDICLNVTRWNDTSKEYEFETDTCQTSTTSGIITSDLLEYTNLTYLTGTVIVDLNDGEGYRVHSKLNKWVGQLYQVVFGDESLVFYIVVIALGAFGYMAHPAVGMLILIIGFVSIQLMGVSMLSVIALMFVIALTIFSMITITKRKQE